jgi:hypothetical protein
LCGIIAPSFSLIAQLIADYTILAAKPSCACDWRYVFVCRRFCFNAYIPSAIEAGAKQYFAPASIADFIAFAPGVFDGIEYPLPFDRTRRQPLDEVLLGKEEVVYILLLQGWR